MTTQIPPYLFFGGRCDEAIGFYKQALGAELVMRMSYSESPQPMPAEAVPSTWGDKVMHATLRIGSALIMASDGCEEGTRFEGFSLSLALATPAEVQRVHAALAVGGRVTMPAAETFWSPCFGMVVDRFGVGWMVTVATA